MREVTEATWREFTAGRNIHLLQTAEWGMLKETFGWRVLRVIEGDFGAQLLFKPLPFGYTVSYIPKLDQQSYQKLADPDVRQSLDEICISQKATFLKIEPDIWRIPGESNFVPNGFKVSKHSIQPPNTILVDISGDEDEILSRMKQKFRYNIRLAEKKGIKIEQSTDVAAFHSLMLETGGRDGFNAHSLEYYQTAFTLFNHAGMVSLVLASYKEKPVAGVMIFAQGDSAWYLYGASSNQERNRMPAYLAQWEALRWARSKGCKIYDLWGIPDEMEETLEANFELRSDGLWGVYRFKRGFGGKIIRSMDAINRVYSPLLYWVYSIRQNLRGIQD